MKNIIECLIEFIQSYRFIDPMIMMGHDGIMQAGDLFLSDLYQIYNKKENYHTYCQLMTISLHFFFICKSFLNFYHFTGSELDFAFFSEKKEG